MSLTELAGRCVDWRTQDGNDHDESLIVVKTVDVEALVRIVRAVQAWLACDLESEQYPQSATEEKTLAALRAALEAVE